MTYEEAYLQEMRAFMDQVRDALSLQRIRDAARRQGALAFTPSGIPYERRQTRSFDSWLQF